MLDIFTMLSLVTLPELTYHTVLSHGCIAKLITVVVKGPGLPVFRVFAATLL